MTIEQAQDALAAGDFVGALAALDALDDDSVGSSAASLEVRARASYGNGSYEDAVSAWEQLHAMHRAGGDRDAAARAAVMTAMLLLIDAGMLSTVRGWVRRAQGMLAASDDGPVHALIAAVLAYERFFSGDFTRAVFHARDAVRLGEQFDVMPAVAIGRTAAGRVAVLDGDLEDGLAQLDEVAALLMSGEVDDLTTGMMFCELICAAQGLMRVDLAREWTDSMAKWAVTGAFGAIRGRCRVHQAELLRLTGPCDAAEREALRACEELRPWLRREFGWPLVELGLTRLRRGDLEGAEDAFLEAGEHVWPTHPGLALLRLAQGDTASAMTEIRAAIAHPVEAPSKELPPFGDLRLAPLFDAQSEIAAAAGDVLLAAEAAAGLVEASSRYRSPTLVATADLAVARHALLAGDVEAALAAARSAVRGFVAVEAPYDIGRAQVVLADACLAAGDSAAAGNALAAAHACFVSYGAHQRAQTAEQRLTQPRVADASGAGARSTRLAGTFRRDGPTWIVELGGESARIKDLKGCRYLHRMVAEPGREFHVLDLVAVESGTIRVVGGASSGLPMLDPAARDAYRRRLADIDEDIDDATSSNDLGRLAKAEADREYLVNELTRGVGLGGRTRQSGDSSERARTAVARTLRYALDEIAAQHRRAAEHLRSAVQTGTYCSYRPDPLTVVTWST